MFGRSISRFFLALIKPNKPQPQPHLTSRTINDCRQFFMMPTCSKDSIEDQSKSYIEDRAKFSVNQLSPETIFQQWDLSQPLKCEIGVLSIANKLSSLESNHLYKVFQQWGQFLLKEERKASQGGQRLKDTFRRILIEFAQAFNSCCYLLKLDENMILIYLRIYFLSQNYRMEDKCHSHLRYVLDHLLLLKKIQLGNLRFILSFTSKFPMQSVYHQKEREILDLIYSSLPRLNKENQPTCKLLINLFFNVSAVSQISAKMKNLVIDVYHNFSNSQVRLKAFSTLIELFLINKSNISDPIHLDNLKEFIEKHPKELFKHVSKLLYRADIWVKEFWVPYFAYMSRDYNFKEVENFSHHIVDDLLVQGKAGGPELHTLALQFRSHLKRNNVNPQRYDLRKEYENQYGRIKQHKSSCQLHVANSMRLICGAQILTEVPIKYFMVDVLVNQKVIVEINNSHHYKVIEGVEHLNLKSQFRQRVLEKNGYKFYTIKVDDLSSSNYSMLEEIYKIVEESGSMKQHKQTPK